MKEEIQLALQWFKSHKIEAYEDHGSVFVYVDFANRIDCQISACEVSFRADQMKEKLADNLSELIKLTE